MKKPESEVKKPGGISDDAVRKRTGKLWREWFAILDEAGGRRMSHKEMAQWLYDTHLDSGWWSQMVAVAYEQARGLRKVHERPQGYEISVSRTIAVALPKAYQAWTTIKQQNQWLGKKGLVTRSATPNKVLHIVWPDGKTTVDVSFIAKGSAKCQVVATHRKLADENMAARMKKYWANALNRLKSMLES